MTYKQIEARRETRLWITQIVVPGITLAATILAIPGVKDSIAEKVSVIKHLIHEKLKKES